MCCYKKLTSKANWILGLSSRCRAGSRRFADRPHTIPKFEQIDSCLGNGMWVLNTGDSINQERNMNSGTQQLPDPKCSENHEAENTLFQLPEPVVASEADHEARNRPEVLRCWALEWRVLSTQSKARDAPAPSFPTVS